MVGLFGRVLVPQIVAREDLEPLAGVKAGLVTLLLLCKQSCPSPVWDDLASLPWQEDAKAMMAAVHEHLGREPGARVQFTAASVEDGQEPGIVRLYTERGHREWRSDALEAVELRLLGEPESVAEWARWCLMVGYLNLLLLEYLRPARLQAELPEDGWTLFCAGVDDRIHLYVGWWQKGAFAPMVEWN